MKVLLFIAIFAIATTHAYDAVAHFNGFVSGLNLTAAQKDIAQKCFLDLKSAEGKAEHAIKDKSLSNSEKFMEAFNTFETVKEEAFPDCAAFVQVITKGVIAARNPNITRDGFAATLKKSFSVRGDFMVQEFFRLIDGSRFHFDFDSGMAEAKLLLLATGAIAPVRKEAPQVNWTSVNFTEISQRNRTNTTLQTFIGYLMAFGNYNVTTATRLTKCSESYTKLMMKIAVARNPMTKPQNNTSFVAKALKAASIAESALLVRRDCAVVAEVTAPFFNKIKNHPLRALFNMLHDTGINLPQIVETAQIAGYNSIMGDYQKAGYLQGAIHRVMTQNA